MARRHKIIGIRNFPPDPGAPGLGNTPADLKRAVELFMTGTPELHVLRLVVEGKGNKEEYLDISLMQGQLHVAINRT